MQSASLFALLLCLGVVRALFPNNPFSSFPWDSNQSSDNNSTLPAALQEWITSTSSTTQQLVNNLMKWKEEINNINITSHLDSFRDLAENFTMTDSSSLNITQTLNKAWDIMNQTLLSSPRPAYAVIQYTTGLTLQELRNIVSVQEQARKMNYFYQLIYVIPHSVGPSKQHSKHIAVVEKADLDTIRDLLPENAFTVMEEAEVADILNHIFPAPPSRNLVLTQSPDHLLLAFLLKRGYIVAADSQNGTSSSAYSSSVFKNILSPLKRLIRPSHTPPLNPDAFLIFSPARLFWLLPARQRWRGAKGAGAGVLSVLERMDDEYVGETDLLALSPVPLDFGKIDRKRGGLFGLLGGDEEGGFGQDEGQSRGKEFLLPPCALLRISTRFIKRVLRLQGQDPFRYNASVNSIDNLLRYSNEGVDVGLGLTASDSTSFAFAQGYMVKEGEDEKGDLPSLVVEWRR